MQIERLEISHVRNLDSVRLPGLDKVNVFFGDNSSGKTSLLESVHVLGLGRSFRTRSFKSVIKKDKEECVVYCSAHEQGGGNIVTVGVRRSRRAAPAIRVNGDNATSISQLAKLFPLQLINSDSFLLLEGAPSVRRQFLDWGVFHVEQSFHAAWLSAKRCLKHRNTLLRHGKISNEELQLWSRELVVASSQVDAHRKRYIREFIANFEPIAAELIQIDGLEIEYLRGWSSDIDFLELLNKNIERDKYQGFTSCGPHRSDLKITKDGRLASEYLSRGQEKLLICALKLAQAATLKKLTSKQCIFLIDDLPAELDEYHNGVLCKYLENLGSQLFVTCTDRRNFDNKWRFQERIKWFHVEHGQITQV